MRRYPWLTVVVTAITAAGLVLQEAVPATLTHLQRSPAALHGEVWRWVTSLLVQDGWLAGGVFNLAGLVIVGVAAEQVASRGAWAVAYLGCGLVGQVFGHYWQPVGGGNSVAVCGLAALCVAVLLTDPAARGIPLTAIAPSLWCGALASSLWTPLLVVGVVLGVASGGPLQRLPWTRYAVAGFCIACAVGLLVTRDIHGGALVVGLVVATSVAVAVKSRAHSTHPVPLG